jgi:hypothetical protein
MYFIVDKGKIIEKEEKFQIILLHVWNTKQYAMMTRKVE